LISFFVIYLAAISWQPTWRPRLMTITTLLIIFSAIAIYATLSDAKINYINRSSIALFIGLALLTLAQFTFKVHDKFWLPILGGLTLLSLTANVVFTLDNFSYLTNTEYQNTIKALTADKKFLKKDASWYRVAQNISTHSW
jgi:hypothetical protein